MLKIEADHEMAYSYATRLDVAPGMRGRLQSGDRTPCLSLIS
jgi:hypothetical protein